MFSQSGKHLPHVVMNYHNASIALLAESGTYRLAGELQGESCDKENHGLDWEDQKSYDMTIQGGDQRQRR